MKQFAVPNIYRSELISAIKNKRKREDKLKKDFSPTLLDFGDLKIYLARHFGFCYGVENAIEIAFRTIEENPGKRIFLLSEMIHNPQVNADLLVKGIKEVDPNKEIIVNNKSTACLQIAIENAKKGSYLTILSNTIDNTIQRVTEHLDRELES